jgi:photosystem II stability/assembly factor-like uncharacterized protein
MSKFFKQLALFTLCLFTFSSLNAQLNWEWKKPALQGNPLESIFFADANNGYSVGQHGTILKTADAGTTWTLKNFGENNLHAVYFTDLNNGYCVGDSGTIFKTTNAGTTWVDESFGSAQLRDVHFPSASVGYAIGYDGVILKTTDAGLTWSSLTSGVTDQLTAVFFTDDNTGFVIGVSGLI